MTDHLILALDTVFEQCSVALLKNDQPIACDTIVGGRGQTERILPMIEQLLQTQSLTLNDLTLLAFNRGPGAFSGIRINTAVVQALSFAHDIPCVGVSSLLALSDAFIHTHQPKQTFILYGLIDARQNEVYACQYQFKDQQLIKTSDEHLLPYHYKITADICIGDGCEFIDTNGKKIALKPSAEDIGRIAYQQFFENGATDAKNALPIYLRDNAWKTLAEQGKS